MKKLLQEKKEKLLERFERTTDEGVRRQIKDRIEELDRLLNTLKEKDDSRKTETSRSRKSGWSELSGIIQKGDAEKKEEEEEQKYRMACELMRKGEVVFYESAYKVFQDIATYKDAARLAEYCRDKYTEQQKNDEDAKKAESLTSQWKRTAKFGEPKNQIKAARKLAALIKKSPEAQYEVSEMEMYEINELKKKNIKARTKKFYQNTKNIVVSVVGLVLLFISIAMGCMGFKDPDYYAKNVLGYFPYPVKLQNVGYRESGTPFSFSVGRKVENVYIYDCKNMKYFWFPFADLKTFNIQNSEVKNLSLPEATSIQVQYLDSEKLKIEDGVMFLDIYNCDNLKSLNLKSEYTLVTYRLESEGEGSITIPEGVDEVVITNSSITELVVPEGVVSVKIENCENLTTLQLPESVVEKTIEGCPGLE